MNFNTILILIRLKAVKKQILLGMKISSQPSNTGSPYCYKGGDAVWISGEKVR